MAVITQKYTPGAVIQGPADIYLNVQNPPSALPPVAGTNTWALNSGTYSIDSNGQPTDNSTTGSLFSATVASGGTGYAIGDIVSVTQSGAQLGYLFVTAETAGAVSAVALGQYGYGYSVATALSTTAVTGSGSGLTVNITAIQAGFHVGLSDGPTEISISPKFLEIRADQHAAPVDAAFTSMEVEVGFVIEEALLGKMQTYFSSTIGTFTHLPSLSGGTAADMLQVGSIVTDASLFSTLLMISPDRANLGHYYVINMYKATLKSAIETTFKRDVVSKWATKWTGIADTSRVFGDQVACIAKI